MVIKLPGHVEITISVMTKRRRVIQDIQVFGRLKAVKLYMTRYNCDLSKAYNYFKKIDEWKPSHL